ncbi:hypothetical protein GCM10011344_42310 [Dokdonia pacifica]|uniref:Helix-turn-helix domain-containing protein n=1 Tax=Dokdonia pacifica TaxID=1627892 RepID=A0A239DN64_9FLAO|nr:helix-turn-helix domain-containing protein [Dokdonia pacifica]GGG36999.1 hypothetical protein GCM10011344_42310 [Dokdonia pacifica]SNS33232.1 Helix-turn-helix domain-containing protein [Dokdonia pacifica]
MLLKIKLFLFICLLFTSVDIHSQFKNSTQEIRSFRNIKTDYKNHFQDSSTAIKFADEYLQKAIVLKDSLRIANGYRLKINLDPEGSKTLNFYDSIIKITKDLKNEKFPTLAFFERGNYNFKKRKFRKALDDYLDALGYNNSPNKDNMSFLLNQNISILKLRIDENKDALNLIRECYDYSLNKNYNEISKETHLGVLFNLSEAYRKNNYLDSAKTKIKMGKKQSKNIKNELFYNLFLTLEGIVNTQDGNYSEGANKLILTQEFLSKKGLIDELAVNSYYLGMAYLGLDLEEKAVSYYKVVDSIYGVTNFIQPETTESYSYLIDWSRKNKNLDKQLYYINRLMEIDSSTFLDYKHFNEKLNTEFDIPLLLNSKQLLIEDLKKIKRTSYYFNIFLTGLTLFLIFIVFFQFYRRRIFMKRYEEIIKKDNKVNNKSDKKKILKDVSSEIESKILNRIKKFEENEEYTDSTITLSTLSKKLKTNSTYLSAIINNNMDCNFSSYLKNIRIEYAFQKIKTDRRFREYTIKAIALESGFKSGESFSKEFYKTHGIYPSFFIKQIKKELK